MATKVTFTLDQSTIDRIERAAERLGIPKSAVVREAVHEFHERLGKLSETERTRMLEIFDTVVPNIPVRPLAQVHNELRALRAARHSAGR